MAPFLRLRDLNNSGGHGKKELEEAGWEAVILEAWGQGLNMGGMIILMLIVACNYRRHIILHKLILLEQFLACFHSNFIFFNDPDYAWYLSASSTLLFCSYELHNVIAFLKIKAFLPKWGKYVFVGTLILVLPYWIIEAWDNFTYFNYGNNWNIYTRPWEPLARDPWWVFTTVFLCYKIKSGYDFTFITLFRTSPRFAVMLFCMVASIGFALGDVIVTADNLTVAKGLNPYWRLSLVFKCAADTIFLDDFKTVLDRIVAKRFEKFQGGLSTGRKKSSHSGRRVSLPIGGGRKGSRPSWIKPNWEKPLELDERKDSRETMLPSVPEPLITVDRTVKVDSMESGLDAPAYDVNICAHRK